jgi:hypothetical protein
MTERNRSQQKAADERSCCDCECDVEWCSFCDREDCAVALCYGCTIRALARSRPGLHDHGG